MPTPKRERVFVVMLRQPRRADSNEMRTDPFWEFGSFGLTGCHQRNLLHPKRAGELSGARLAKALMTGMLDRKWGRIVFISSESGINVPADMIHYGVTKTAMLSLANGLSKLTKGTEVTVNSILGGPTYSDGVAGTVEKIAEAQGSTVEQMKAAILAGTNPHSLLQRFIAPEEIAALAAYLCSPLAAATNGSSLRADGGVLQTL